VLVRVASEKADYSWTACTADYTDCLAAASLQQMQMQMLVCSLGQVGRLA
jgi:hypothetical protein